MAHQDTKFEVSRGPSKLDLMFALFDTSKGVRTVKFRIANGFYDVEIVSIERIDPLATTWNLQGTTRINDEKKRVSILYQSSTRKGAMEIENV